MILAHKHTSLSPRLIEPNSKVLGETSFIEMVDMKGRGLRDSFGRYHVNQARC